MIAWAGALDRDRFSPVERRAGAVQQDLAMGIRMRLNETTSKCVFWQFSSGKR